MILANALFVLLCIQSSLFAYGGRCKTKKLTEDQQSMLTTTYDLKPSQLAPLLSGQIWKSPDVLPDGRPQVQGRILVLKKGYCGKWTVFSVNRFYQVYEGKAIIEMIYPNGTRVTECLGSTLCDDDCHYAVAIPKGVYSVIKMTGKLAVISGVIINGDGSDGRVESYSAMKEMFGGCCGDVISETKKCYEIK